MTFPSNRYRFLKVMGIACTDAFTQARTYTRTHACLYYVELIFTKTDTRLTKSYGEEISVDRMDGRA